jgi:hypothetical protein
MAEHKPNKALVETPMEYLCGNPEERNGSGTEDTIYGLKGPEGVSANGGINFNLITPIPTAGDRPSDSKQFKGQSDD